MKKTLLTTLVCAQLLITPQLHAWEMPKNLDGKQIGIVATVAAALVTLIGIACYAYKKKGVAAQVTQPENAQANESVQKIAKDVESLKKKLTDLEQLSQPLHAFHAEQLKQPSLVQPIVEGLTSHWEQIDKEMKKQAEARAKELEALKKDQAALKQEIFERFEKILQSHAQEPRVAVEEHDGLGAVPGQPESDVHEERAEIFLKGLEDTNAQLRALKADVDGEVAFREQQLKTIQETLSKNEQIFAAHYTDIDRHTKLIAQWALRISELSRKIALLPTREDLEKLKKEQEAEIGNFKRFVNAALLRMTSLRNINVESDPELTRMGLALNEQHEKESGLTDTAERLRVQKEEQEEQLQQLLAQAKKVRKRSKGAKNKGALLAAPVHVSIPATLPDGKGHTPSECGEHALSGAAPVSPAPASAPQETEVASPFGAASHPLAALDVHDDSQVKPLKEGQDFPSLSPAFRAQHGMPQPTGELSTVMEETSADDFAITLTPKRMTELQQAVTTKSTPAIKPEDLAALNRELDAPHSAKPMSDDEDTSKGRVRSLSH